MLINFILSVEALYSSGNFGCGILIITQVSTNKHCGGRGDHLRIHESSLQFDIRET